MDEKFKKPLTIITIVFTNLEVIFSTICLFGKDAEVIQKVIELALIIQVFLLPYLFLLSDIIRDRAYKKTLEQLEVKKDLPSPFSFKWYIVVIILATMTMCIIL